MLFQNTIGCPSAITIKKEVKIQFDKNLLWFMDCDFYHRIYLSYGEPIFIYKPIVVNYIHPYQVTSRINQEIINKEKNYLIKSRNVTNKFFLEYKKIWKNKTILDTNLEILH